MGFESQHWQDGGWLPGNQKHQLIHPPGLSCLVSCLNHSIGEPDPVWEYSVSKSVHATFEVIAPEILITNSDLTDVLRIT